MDLAKWQVSIADIAAQGGEIRAALEKDGKLNLQRLAPPASDPQCLRPNRSERQ